MKPKPDEISHPFYIATPRGMVLAFWINPKDNSMNMDLPAMCEAVGVAPTEANKSYMIEALKKAIATDPDFADIRKIPLIELSRVK
jgi:hypothetical protein